MSYRGEKRVKKSLTKEKPFIRMEANIRTIIYEGVMSRQSIVIFPVALNVTKI
jgi:hypothetical protein